MAKRLWPSKLILFLFSQAFALHAFAQTVPQKLNVSGALYNPGGTPVTQASVDFKIEILDKAATCVLYSEDHTAQNLSNSKGGFSLEVGSGTNAQNYLQGTTALSWQVFANSGVASAAFTGCASGVTMNPGDERLIRVSYNLGSGLVALTPEVPVTSASYAMVADTLGGKTPSEFIQVKDDVGTDLNQSNVENVFSATNFAKLLQLLNNTFTGGYSFNNQRVTNVASPTAGTDAVNRNYVDTHIGDKSAVLTGVGSGTSNGVTLIWDATNDRWTTGTPTATDNTKLPLAGGTMSGAISMAGFDLYHTGHITMANQRLLQLGTFTSAQEGALSLAAGDRGKVMYNTDTASIRMWNGSAWAAVGAQAQGAAGGDLSGSYPNPTINAGAVDSVKIANNAITSAKINSTGIATNMLLSTDASTGATVTYVGCGLNEVMKFDATGKWSCTTVGALLGNSGVTAGMYGTSTTVPRFGVNALGAVTSAVDIAIGFPVTSVASKTGNVVLNAGDIAGLGTAALEYVGTGAGNVPQLDAGGKILESLLPNTVSRIVRVTAGAGLSGGGTSADVTLSLDVANVDAYKLRGSAISAIAPANNEVLMWNNATSMWTPQAVPSAPVSSVAGRTGAVVLDVSDINSGAGKYFTYKPSNAACNTNEVLKWNGSAWLCAADNNDGDITQVVAGTGMTGGGSVGVLTLNLADTAVTAANYGGAARATSFTVDQQGRLTAASDQLIALPTTQINQQGANANEVLKWNGAAWMPAADLGMTALSGDVTASGSGSQNVTILNDKITSAKINSTGIAVSRLLITDATNGNSVTYANCGANGQVLKYNSTLGWECANDAGAAGVVTQIDTGIGLAGGPITTSGSIYLAATAVTPNSYGGAARTPSFTVDQQGRLTAASDQLIALPTTQINQQGATQDQILKWNGSAWMPATDTGITTLTAGNGILLSGTNTVQTIAVDTGITANKILQLDANGLLGIGTASVTAGSVLDIFSTGSNRSSVILPRSTTADRPLVGIDGMIRYNTSLAKFEVYENGNWYNMATGATGDNLGNHTATQAIVALTGSASTPSYTFSGDADTGFSAAGTNRIAASTGGTERVRITEMGFVGVGTAAPGAKLHVDQGDVIQRSYFNGQSSHGFISQKAAGTQGSPTAVTNLDGLGFYMGMGYDGTNYQNAAYMNFGVDGTVSSGIVPGRVDIYTAGADGAVGSRITMRASGNVGVGSGSPQAILDVNGTGVTSAIVVPRETTANRPVSGVNGMLRYNTNLAAFEVYANNAWSPLLTNATAPAGDNLGNGVATTVVTALTGTAGTPSYTFSGDTDTGFYNLGTNRIAASTGGTERLRVNEFGMLQVLPGSYGAGTGVLIGNNTTGSTTLSFDLSAASGGYSSIQSIQGVGSAYGFLALNPNGGGLGIGTSSGNYRLNVQGSGSASSMVSLASFTSGSSPNNAHLYGIEVSRWGAEAAYLGINKNSATGGVPSNSVYLSTYNSTGTISLGRSTNGAVSTMTSDLFVSGNGFVGISTTTPGAELEVGGTGGLVVPRGTTAARGLTGINGMLRYNTNLAAFEVYANNAWSPLLTNATAPAGDNLGNGVATTVVTALTGTAGTPSYTFSGDTDTGFSAAGTNRIAASTGGTERMRINEFGFVGIGTANPARTMHILYQDDNFNDGILLRNTSATGQALSSMTVQNDAAKGGSMVSFGSAFVGPLQSKFGLTSDENMIFLTDSSLISGGTKTMQFQTGGWNTSPAMTILPGNPGYVGIATSTPAAPLEVAGTSGIIVPRNTTAARAASGVNGMIRYNTNNARFEVYEGGTWTNMTATGAGDNLGTGVATTAVQAITGTAATPSYTFADRQNRGMYALGTGGVGFSAGSLERMRINPNGYIGIGTTVTPFQLNVLDDVGVGGTVYFGPDCNNGCVSKDGLNSIGNMTIQSHNGGNVYLAADNGGGISILATNGYVGIATATPTAPLDVVGTSGILVPRGTTVARAAAGVNGMIRYNTNNSRFEVYESGTWTNMTATGAGDNLGTGVATTAITAITGTAATPSYTFAGQTNRGIYALGTGSIAFSTASQTKMVVDPSGYIGVGTSTPRGYLHIAPNSGGDPATAGWELLLQNDPNVAGNTNLGMVSGNSGTSTINFGTRTDMTVGSIAFDNASNFMKFSTWNGTAATERMRILGANVGIGSTTPGAILDVAGTSGIIVPRGTTADRAAAGVNGMIRYNTNNSKFEVYVSGAWADVSTGSGAGDNLGNGVATTAITAITGTGATPSYTFSGDTDTGLWNVGSNRIGFSTGGTERMRMTELGYIGISAAPAAYDTILLFGAPLGIPNSGGNYIGVNAFSGFTGDFLHMENNGTPVFRVSTDGQVRIGTGSVNVPTGVANGVTGAGNNLTGTTYITGLYSDYWATQGVALGHDTTGTNVAVVGAYKSAAAASQLAFWTANSAGTYSEKMRITGSGQVGIGTTAPNAELDVAGTAGILVPRSTTANRAFGINGMIRYNTDLLKFEVYQGSWQNMISSSGADNLGTGVATTAITAITGTAATPSYTFAGESNRGIYALGTGGIAFSTASAERMKLESTGMRISHTQTSHTGGLTIDNTIGGGYGSSLLFISDGWGTDWTQGLRVTNDNGGSGIVKGKMEFLGVEASASITPMTLYGSKLGIGSGNPAGELDVVGSAGIIVPRGTTTARAAAGVNGMIRYNTNNAKFEAYVSGAWADIATGAGAGDNLGTGVATTKITAITGTGSTPSLTFAGLSSNSGLYANGTGTLAVSMAGVPRFSVATNGVVGVNGAMNFYDWSGFTTSTGTMGYDSGGVGNGIMYFTAQGTNSTTFEFKDCCNTVMAISDTLGTSYFRYNLAVYGKQAIGTDTVAAGAELVVAGTGGIIVPRATTAQRPFGVNGMIRYNTTSLKFEVYEGNWQNMISGGDNLGSHTASSTIVAITGTATAPSYGFSGGNYRGMFATGTGGIAFSTSSSDRIRIEANGNVGIGSMSPANRLSVYDTTSNALPLAVMSSPGWGSGDYTGVAFGPSTLKGALIFQESIDHASWGRGDFVFALDSAGDAGPVLVGDEKMRLTNLGRLGIGSATPSAELDVVGTSGIMIPRSTTANRPFGINGLIRYNTTSLKFEVYEGRWQNMLSSGGGGGVTDLDGLSDAIYDSADVSLYLGTTVGNTSGTGDANYGFGNNVMDGLTTGAHNIGVGYYAMKFVTTGNQNIAIGGSALQEVIGGSNNIAIGKGTLGAIDNGNDNVAIGTGAIGNANNSASANVAIGHGSGFLLTGSNNVLVGALAGENITSGSKNIVVGYDIDAPSATDSNQLNIGNIIFGTGVSGTGTTVAGSIGIGRSDPFTPLHVNYPYAKTDTTTREGFTVSSNDGAGYFKFYVTMTGAASQANRTANLQTAEQMSSNSGNLALQAEGGLVGIGTYTPDQKLVVYNGSTTGKYTTSGWTHTSDIRLKQDIAPLANSLEKITQLQGVEYKFTADPLHEKQIGFIAQQVEPIFPEVVKTDKDGFKSMIYSNLVAPLVESVKALYHRLVGVERDIAQIKNDDKLKDQRIQQLEQENAAMKAYLCSKDPQAPICK